MNESGGDSGAGGRRVAAKRSSVLDSLRGCGMGIDEEDLRRRVRIPGYIRTAMAQAIRSKDVSVVGAGKAEGAQEEIPPETPLVVFVNSRSGGRHGEVLRKWLVELMGEEQVFDLSNVKPSDFVQYGLGCLENMARLGDNCAKVTREKLRVMVAGGDGTVGWVLGSLGELHLQKRTPVPPTGIIPLGTGNDLSRSFGWGGSFPFCWRSAIKRSLLRATTGQVCHLDSWQIAVSMPAGETIDLPHCLRHMETASLSEHGATDGELSDKISCFGGVFYNYFSIGMDAQVAYGFHRLRDKKPYLARGPISNKMIYSGYSCSQGWFCTPCLAVPGLRGLKNIVQLHIKRANCLEWEHIPIPSSVRALVAVNLQNYGSGRNPWGHPKPKYLDKKGFVEAHVDDGLLEIFGLKQGWHASLVMVEVISAKHIAQAAAIRLEIRGGPKKNAFLQMDGEPWKQPIKEDFSTFVDITRVPHHSAMINGE